MGLLLFKKVFFDPIRLGQKRLTIRRWNRPRVATGSRAFCPGLGYLNIESVEPASFEDLSDDDARSDGFESLGELKRALLLIYPDNTDGKCWWRVRFNLDAKRHVKKRSVKKKD